jgi:uracil-DNA glycosylase family 4
MAASGPENPDILEVGERAGYHEIEAGAQFVGKTGQILREAERRVGLNAYKIARVNAVRCGMEKPSPDEIKFCRPMVQADIERLHPKLVIPVGAVALRSTLKLAKISDRHGMVFRQDGMVYLPIHHPSAISRNPSLMKDWLEDLQQARSILDGICGKVDLLTRLRKRYKIIRNHRELDIVLAYLWDNPLLCWDTEFQPLEWLSKYFICLGSVFSTKPREGFFLPIDHPESPFLRDKGVKREVAKLIVAKPLIVHFAEAEAVVAERCFDVEIKDLVIAIDTMSLSMAVHGVEVSHRLKNLAYNLADTGGYDQELEKIKKEQKIERYGDIPLKILGNPYACGDTDTTIQIAPKLSKQLVKSGQVEYYNKILKNNYKLNIEMRRNGLLIDWDEWNWRHQFFQDEMEQVYARLLKRKKIHAYAKLVTKQKKTFSLRSDQQMRTLLYVILGLKQTGRVTDGGKASVDKKALKLLRLRPKLSIDTQATLDAALAASQIGTASSTYINGYAKRIWEDGRVHPDWRSMTTSNRRNVSNPNVQNLPDGLRFNWRGDPDRNPFNLRMLIRSRPGYVFVGSDYAQVEFRLAANYSGDTQMIADCQPKPNDAHTKVGKKYGVDRLTAKTINFLRIYRGGPSQLQDEIFDRTGKVTTFEWCCDVVNDLNTYYPQLVKTIDYYQAFARKHKYVITPVFGHRRLLPHVDSDDQKIREEALREGWNHMVQAMAHAILELSMNEILDRIWKEKLPWYFELDAHDGFLLEVPEDQAAEAGAYCKLVMEAIPAKALGDWRKVDLPAEISIGTHYGALKEVA